VFIAHLGKRKGGDILIQALDQLRTTISFELVVIGDVEPLFLRQLQSATTPELWKHVKFKPRLQTPEIAKELASAALMVCPTRADTGPMAVKEAVIAGVPVVGSAIGGVTDYVVPNKNGILFAPGKWEECLVALRTAVTHPLFGKGLVDPETLLAKRRSLSPERMKASFLNAYSWARYHYPSKRKA
jgi:glycosyltransferase involved in cell wall biosynthesis